MRRLQEDISAKPWEARDAVAKEGPWLDTIPFDRPQLAVQQPPNIEKLLHLTI